MKKIIVVFSISIFTLIACKSSKTISSASQSTTIDPMVNGKSLYMTKCSKCHELPKVEDFTAQKWTGIVDWMAPKAKLTKEEKAMVLEYVHAMAKK